MARRTLFDDNWRVNHQRTSLTGIHRKVMSLLDNLHEDYVIEKEFGPYSADIYLPSRKIVIEADGNKWHGGKAGCDHDRERDRYIMENFGVPVYRMLGTDIENDAKVSVLLEAILAGDMIRRPQEKGSRVMARVGGKTYSGTVTRVNEYSYAVSIPRLDRNVTMERSGLFNLDGKWHRCVEYTKSNAIPAWCGSLSRMVSAVMDNLSLPECEAFASRLKEYIRNYKPEDRDGENQETA